MVQKPINANQDLLGYRLKERIGAGGYGEVWSAEAPGGLMKAVKIVFGYHDERRAQNELRSLDRIKGLRHPFLLNLERIDIVDGQLVIITELADKSLADEYNDWVLQGEPGIPRDKLLNQMMEAADALDYISEKHSLQHLDIKPENLLMVGRHVKVADFGLVKDLQDVSQSLMGGLTPAYAAPELFDGRPSSRSDQYSLAIVFQEMLTGQRPFPGTTPAALAAQHMNGKPNLRPLAKSDQLVIAKALSKDANVRFTNCVAMVEELISRHNVKKPTTKKIVAPRSSQDTESREIKVRSGIVATKATDQINSTVFQDQPVTRDAAPDCTDIETTLSPALFVGIGNSANQVIRKLRQRMIERFGGMDLIPSFRMLCIDTDRQEITDLSRLDDGYDVSQSETLLLPLRKPEDYRSRQKAILSWLSRRWIYNVPRTLKTEGIRPLGRLALIDNFESVYEALQSNIEELSKPELLAASAETIGLAPGNVEPDVFIVSSISGGTGSGMTNDMAYIIKLVLSEHGLPMNRINGLMMHSTCMNVSDPGLAATNSFAFLTELRHFTQYGFPGDDSKGLPDLPDESPFDAPYFLNLGSDLQPAELESKFGDIAEYLFLNTLSNSRRFFQQCRSASAEDEGFSLRGVGISSSGVSNLNCYYQLVEQLCHLVIKKWVHGDSQSTQAAQMVVSQIDVSEIDAAKVLSSLQHESTAIQQSPSVVQFRNSLLQRLANPHGMTLESLTDELDSVFGANPVLRGVGSQQISVCSKIKAWVGQKASELGNEACKLIATVLEQERLDIKASLLTTQHLTQLIKSQRDQISGRLSATRDEIEQLKSSLLRWNEESQLPEYDTALESLVDSFIQVNLQEVVFRFGDQFFHLINGHVANLTELFTQYASQLQTTVGSRFGETGKRLEETTEGSSFDLIIARQLESALPHLVGSTELSIYHDLIKDRGGYGAAIDDLNCLNYLLPEQLRQIAQVEIARAARRIEIDRGVAESQIKDSGLMDWIQSVEKTAEPMLDQCGGVSRRLITTPADCSGQEIASCFRKQDEPRIEFDRATFGDFVMVNEVESVPLANVAFRMLQFRPDCIDLTKRLYTRSDIDWMSLEDLL